MGKKITFVNLCGPDFQSRSIPPIGICSIIGYLNQKVGIPGDKIGFVEDLLYNADHAVHRIVQEDPEFVGVSTISAEQTIPNIYLMMRIKEELSNTCIITGGAHASGIPDSFLRRSPWLDVVVIGEGEIPTAELLKVGTNQGAESKWVRIPNIMFRIRNGSKKGEIVETQKKIFDFEMNDINSYYPKHNLKFHNTFTIDDMLEFSSKGVSIPIETSRGCPFSCNFCMVPGIFKQQYRIRPVKAVIKDIQLMDAKFGEEVTGEPARFIFWDANFGMNKKWRNEWLQSIGSLSKRVEWECETRVDIIDYEVMKRYYEAGLIQCTVGIESGSERIREQVLNKNLNLNRLLDTTHRTKDLIHYVFFFIMGAPSETVQEMKETIDLAKKMSQELGLSPYNHEYVSLFFKIYPKTFLTEHLENFFDKGTEVLIDKEWWFNPNEVSWYNRHIKPSFNVNQRTMENLRSDFYKATYGFEFNEERIFYEDLMKGLIQRTIKKYYRQIIKNYSNF